MKKYLITSAAALAFCGLFTSCSHDVDGLSAEESVAASYEKAFITAFGQPAPTQTWGFGSTTTAKARTRGTVAASTEVGPTFNATMSAMSDRIAAAISSGANYNDLVNDYRKYQSWWNSGWQDKFYQIHGSVTDSKNTDEYLAHIRDIILTEIPERRNNLDRVSEMDYTITTKGGPVTLTPIYHNSSSADLISYYYYPAGEEPTVEQIKAMKKYTIGNMANPEICKNNNDNDHMSFYKKTYTLVFEENGVATEDFPAGYKINFIISNTDLTNPDLTIYESGNSSPFNTSTIHDYPEFYGDGRLNTAIHNCEVDNVRWKVGEGIDDNTSHIAIFSIGDKNYVGFEDWVDFDYNDVIFEVVGTTGGTPIEDVVRVVAEDLTASAGNDFDFNDVVFDVSLNKDKTYALIVLRAAGGTLPLYIGEGEKAVEVHEMFQQATNMMINTGGSAKGYANCVDGLAPQGFALPNPLYGQEGYDNVRAVAKAIKVVVMKNVGGTITPCELKAEQGEATAKLCVGTDYEYTENGKTYPCLTERTDIQGQFIYHSDTHGNYNGRAKFPLYVKEIFGDDWYQTTAQPK